MNDDNRTHLHDAATIGLAICGAALTEGQTRAPGESITCPNCGPAWNERYASPVAPITITPAPESAADVAPGAHLDIRPQRYIGGEFVTACTCGETFAGQDPDAADAAQLEHRDAAELEGGEPTRAATRGAAIMRGSLDQPAEDRAAALGDTLADLQHYAATAGIDWAEAVERGARYFGAYAAGPKPWHLNSSNAQALTELGVMSYVPWWGGLTVAPRGSLIVTHDTEDGNEGEHEGTTTLTADAISAAVTAMRLSGNLCCARDIAAEGLGMGCAEDADLILQHAVFGRIVFG